MWSVVIPLLLAASLWAQPGGVTGVVVDHNGKPLARVHLPKSWRRQRWRMHGRISDGDGSIDVSPLQSIPGEQGGFLRFLVAVVEHPITIRNKSVRLLLSIGYSAIAE